MPKTAEIPACKGMTKLELTAHTHNTESEDDSVTRPSIPSQREGRLNLKTPPFGRRQGAGTQLQT